MISESHRPVSGLGTRVSPKFYDGPSDVQQDVRVHIRYFTYQTEKGLVAGRNNSDVFTIDRPVKDVWPVIKDSNLWQNAYGFYYSAVVGDLFDGDRYYLSAAFKPKASADAGRYESAVTAEIDRSGTAQQVRYPYDIVKILPEHLIVLSQPIPEDGSTGGISPGFHVIMLQEHEGKTIVNIYTEHATLTRGKTEEEALAPWREGAAETLRKFRDCFIPTIKKLVYEGKSAPR